MSAILTEEEIKRRAEWMRRAENWRLICAAGIDGNIREVIAMLDNDNDCLHFAAEAAIIAATASVTLRNAALTGIPPSWEPPVPVKPPEPVADPAHPSWGHGKQ